MKPTFEDRLLDQLKQEIGRTAVSSPTPVRRRIVTPRRVALGLAACGAAAAVGVVLPSTQGNSAAYAVEKHSNGAITVTVNDISLNQAEQQALAAKVRAAGVRASIQNPDKGFMCGDPGGKLIDYMMYAVPPEAVPPGEEKSWSVTLQPGDTLVVVNQQEFRNFGAWTSFFGTKGAAEPCKQFPLPILKFKSRLKNGDTLYTIEN